MAFLAALSIFFLFLLFIYMKSNICTYKNGGYTGIFVYTNLHTRLIHHTPIANSFIHVGMLGLDVLG